MLISDCSSDVCSSDLHGFGGGRIGRGPFNRRGAADQIDAQVAGVAAPVDPEIGIAQVNRPGLRDRALRCRIVVAGIDPGRSEEHTSELQSLMRISYAVFCLKKKKI